MADSIGGGGATTSANTAVVTGIGLVTPAGIGVSENWKRVVAGIPTAAIHAELADCALSMACCVPDFPPGTPGLRRGWQFDPFTQFAVTAAHEALTRAGLDPDAWPDSSRVAVVLGSGSGGAATMEEQIVRMRRGGPNRVSPLTLPMGLANMAAGQIAIEFGAQGPCLAPSTACASGATAIGIGRDLLRTGAADIVIAGGADACITPMYISALFRMGALSRRTDDAGTASRPFDVDRDGMLLAEGAGVLILESEEHARQRGARPLARIAGFGASADAHHVTSPHPEGRGAKLAMRNALADAGLGAGDVDYVNAHGTSTPLNDSVEAKAIHAVLGPDVAVSSTKGVTGHPLGAAGAIEAAYAVLAILDGVIPPTANLTRPDPVMAVDLVHTGARYGPVDVVMSNSFGFGGQNATLLITA
ncbi:beta-ketoacyl-[acyl-carrier-protein] synthase family protein [Catenulispora sp. NF23]|uniref:Beta-ketoacyl-[acyl-carrier-protein] synthase family protein n=2 Tax=Catenulispora pinistramenti TaxID=2705254 RepID=A0ABS5KJ39_9ACTN|nr:beta-ketoacyl-[acyl-carrier-protein] synthase family protein [Catenulispora pinistramenti]MBS2531153.1 beta-ketoacyl-[acyl-carrier-protein] synthase family protein [Catenulispora pinistramenti]MBS2545915.1 beta-ketoacyl-[acyl-carrier-protein] synthase family protein [Catenulispora pinistramenti]